MHYYRGRKRFHDNKIKSMLRKLSTAKAVVICSRLSAPRRDRVNTDAHASAVSYTHPDAADE